MNYMLAIFCIYISSETKTWMKEMATGIHSSAHRKKGSANFYTYYHNHICM